ncbi:MAG: hypothetical protein AAF916_08010 [Planctomycetota bacterium]
MPATPEFEIGPETEHATHWSYAVTIFHAGEARKVDLTLSFQDYDHWSRGGVPPVKVADAALRFALEQIAVADLPETLDCSTIARRFPAFNPSELR